MAWSASLLITNDLAELARLAAWIEAWANQHAVPEHTAQQVDLCAAEAVTNVLTYGEAGTQAGDIEIRIGRDGDDVVFEVEDNGVAFDPTQAPPAPPVTRDSDRVGGWGIQIVRRLSDNMRYQRVDGRNRLTLTFHPRPQPAT